MLLEEIRLFGLFKLFALFRLLDQQHNYSPAPSSARSSFLFLGAGAGSAAALPPSTGTCRPDLRTELGGSMSRRDAQQHKLGTLVPTPAAPIRKIEECPRTTLPRQLKTRAAIRL